MQRISEHVIEKVATSHELCPQYRNILYDVFENLASTSPEQVRSGLQEWPSGLAAFDEALEQAEAVIS